MKENVLHKLVLDSWKAARGPTVPVFKVHGGPYQTAGLPDIMGCIDGTMLAWECKVAQCPRRPGTPVLKLSLFTELQRHWLVRLGTAGADAAGIVLVSGYAGGPADYVLLVPWYKLESPRLWDEVVVDEWPANHGQLGRVMDWVKAPGGRLLHILRG